MSSLQEGATVRGFGLDPGGGEGLSWMGEPTLLKLTGEQSGRLYSLAEIVSTPEGFVPLHVHHREDEAFFVLEGEVTFTIGDQTVEAGPGSFAFGPRDVPHRYTVITPRARMLMLFSPAGFEGFIRETSAPPETGSEGPDLEQIAEAAARYGAELLE